MLIEGKKSKASLSNFKTLTEYCPIEINIEVEVLRIAKKLKVFSADDLHELGVNLMIDTDTKKQLYALRDSTNILSSKFKHIDEATNRKGQSV